MEAVVAIGRQLGFGFMEHRFPRGAGAFRVHHVAGVPEDGAGGIQVQQLLLKQRLLPVLPFDHVDEDLGCFRRGYILELLCVLRHPFRLGDLGSQGRHETGGQHLVEVIAVLVQVLIVGILGVVALVHPIDGAEEVRFPGAEGDELIALEELQILQAPLHQHDAVLGPLVFVSAHQGDQALLIFFGKLGAVLGLIRCALHGV